MLGVARVHVASLEGDASHGGVEVLIFEFADFTSVHRVGPVGAKPFHVEVVGSLTYLFIGGESDAYLAMLDFGVGEEVLHGRYDFGHAGFVVGTQQCLAIGDDEVLPDVVQQLGKLVGAQCHIVFGAEHDFFAVVVLDDARRNFAARAVGTGVEVGDESHRGQFLVAVRGQGGH